jgi:hypothetical protein
MNGWPENPGRGENFFAARGRGKHLLTLAKFQSLSIIPISMMSVDKLPVL